MAGSRHIGIAAKRHNAGTPGQPHKRGKGKYALQPRIVSMLVECIPYPQASAACSKNKLNNAVLPKCQTYAR
eukprot:405820-Amphidinium_carterae.1